MSAQLYHPFKKMRFDNSHCFLSGEALPKDQADALKAQLEAVGAVVEVK